MYTEQQITEIVKRVINELYPNERELLKDEKIELANNPNTPPKTLELLATDEDYYVRWGVADNPNTPPKTLELLATDGYYGVRWNVAENPNTPPKTLELLATDKNYWVRYWVTRNPNYAPKESLTITKQQKQALTELIKSSQNPVLKDILK